MNSDEYDRLRAEIMAVNAQVMAVQTLLSGLAMALNKHNFPDDLIRDAFTFAEEGGTVIAGNPNRDVSKLGADILQILENLRQSMLPGDRPHRV